MNNKDKMILMNFHIDEIINNIEILIYLNKKKWNKT